MVNRMETVDAWLLRDDVAAVYVNGFEVFRDQGLPANATYATYSDEITGGENTTTTFSIDPRLLVDGTNVIGVEVHQQTPHSSDLSFDFSLTAELITSAPAIVTIDISSSPALPGDVNLDGAVDDHDIDDLYAAIGAGSNDLQYDVDRDGEVKLADADYLISAIFNTTRGDTDLDGDVDTGDLTRAIIGFTGAGGIGHGWASGDTDGDGDVDTGDLTRAIIRFTGAQ